MADSSPIRGLLLASAGTRLAAALVAVACIWGTVLWAVLVNPPPPPVSETVAVPLPPALRLIVASGQPAPTGGSFDRFDVGAQPIVAPVNANGHVAFYASIGRAKVTEGLFLATGTRI